MNKLFLMYRNYTILSNVLKLRTYPWNSSASGGKCGILIEPKVFQYQIFQLRNLNNVVYNFIKLIMNLTNQNVAWFTDKLYGEAAAAMLYKCWLFTLLPVPGVCRRRLSGPRNPVGSRSMWRDIRFGHMGIRTYSWMSGYHYPSPEGMVWECCSCFLLVLWTGSGNRSSLLLC